MKKLLHTISQASWLKPYSERYMTLSPKDQGALKLLACFLVALLIYLLLWSPSQAYRASAEAIYASNLSLYAWMQENEGRAKNVSRPANLSLASSASLLSLVDNSARSQNIRLQRYEPNQEDGVRVWLENTNFNSLVIWLEKLSNENSVSIVQLSIEKRAAGLVDARIELAR